MGVHPFGDPGLTDEWAQQPVAVDATDFHVYARRVGLPDALSPSSWTTTWSRSSASRRRYPMQFMLGDLRVPGAPTARCPRPSSAPRVRRRLAPRRSAHLRTRIRVTGDRADSRACATPCTRPSTTSSATWSAPGRRRRSRPSTRSGRRTASCRATCGCPAGSRGCSASTWRRSTAAAASTTSVTTRSSTRSWCASAPAASASACTTTSSAPTCATSPPRSRRSAGCRASAAAS